MNETKTVNLYNDTEALSRVSTQALVAELNHRRRVEAVSLEMQYADFVEHVAWCVKASPEEIISPRRVEPLVGYRQAGMAAMRDCFCSGLKTIAQAFNRRDHGTVLHAISKTRGQPDLLALKHEIVRTWRERNKNSNQMPRDAA